MARPSGLLTAIEDRVGEALRVIATYDSDGYTVVRVRSDLDRDRVHGRLGLIYTNLPPTATGNEPALDRDLGPHHATVCVRERAAIIRLPIGETRGLLLGVEPSVSTDLDTLIDVCRAPVDEDPDSFDDLPSTVNSE